MVAHEPDTGFRYWAFISYSHQDKSWGRWLHRALETYRIPQRLVGMPVAAGTIPARLSPVFRDRDELPTSSDLDRSVAEALRQSWCLIVICSPAAAQSRWVNEEIREFQQLGRAERIHCLIVDGTADSEVPCFPPALLEQAQDGAAPAEPIAADVRRHGDGKAHARLKLVAGILGVSFDQLVRREHQRSYRRMAMIAGGAVLALAVLTIFSVVAVTSRRDAEAQRGHAEGLVEFMLGDLRNRLEPEGHLSTLDAVGKEALAYYAAQDPASLDADALARRARALHMIGEVYDQRGRLDDALGVFKQAAVSTGELLERDKNNPQRIFDHAQSVYWVGLIAYQRGKADTAENAFKNYQVLAERLVAIDAGNADWQAEVEYAYSNLGTLLFDQDRADDAATSFEHALQVAQMLGRQAPNDAARQIELAQSHAWLADARVMQGRFQEGIKQRQAELAIYEEILALDSKNRDAKNGVLVAERELGLISLMLGDTPMALTQSRRAVAIADELTMADPENVGTADEAAGAYAVFGEALDDSGDIATARIAAARAREIYARLVARDPSVVKWQSRLSRSLLLQAQLTAADGNALDALRQVHGVIQRLDALHQSNRLDRNARLEYARALLMSGDQNEALGNLSQAHDDWQSLIALLRADQRNAGPPAEGVMAIALLKLGRADESAAIQARLERLGYRNPVFVRAMSNPATAEKSAEKKASKVPNVR